MTLQLDVTTRTNMASQVAAALAGGSVKLFSGAVPATCAAADPSGVLASGTLPNPALSAAAGAVTESGSWTATASNGATAASFRCYDNGGACRAQGSVGWNAAQGNWAAQIYAVGNTVWADGNAYRLATVGTGNAASAPTGTTTYTDSAGYVWTYLGPMGDLSVDNPVLNTGQTITFLTFSYTMPAA